MVAVPVWEVSSIITFHFKIIMYNERLLRDKQIPVTFKQNMKQADITESVRKNSFTERHDMNEFRDKNSILLHN